MMGRGGKAVRGSVISIRDYKSATQPTYLTPIDRGEDIH
jgi:hypothetical protein